MMANSSAPRRPLKTRERGWAMALARALASTGLSPNQISVFGVLAAGIACAFFVFVPLVQPERSALLLVAAAAFVQLRLLCNMLDGMLAIESGRKSVLGEVYNDLPDRLSDSLILVGAGYSLGWVGTGMVLGWAAALAAMMTAYVRVLAGSLGAQQFFLGPMAKQHRMFVVTLAAVATAAVQVATHGTPPVMWWALVVIVAGSALTVARRTMRLARELKAR